MDILTGNKLIAEFCEVEKCTDNDHADNPCYHLFGKYRKVSEMEYHSSWDWLMPVVEKIPTIVIKSTVSYNSDYSPRIEIVPSGYVKINDIKDTPIFRNVSVEKSFITATWKAVIDFIIWYNNQNPTSDIKG